MVSSGLTFQRVISRAVFAVFSLVFLISVRAESVEVAGTLPEDYLPALKEIIANALRRSPDLIVKEFDRMAQEARVTQANASRLPHLGGNFNYGTTQTATAANTSRQERNSGFFYNLGVSQAIFHWGALKNEREAARISLLVTEKNYALAYRELSVVLRKAYLALIVEKARVRQGRESLRIVADDVAVATYKKEAGTLSGGALEGERLRLRESTLEFNRVAEEFEANRRRFARLAGIPESAFPADQIPLEIAKPNYSEPRTAALTATLLRDNAKSTLEYGIYDLKLRDAVLRQKIAATRLLPKFGANASYSLENTTNVNGNVAEQSATIRQSIGIGGSWDIFDGFATGGAKREALIAKRTIEQRKATEIELLLQNAQTLERELKLDAEQVELSDLRHGIAIDGYRRISTEVEFGNLPRGEVERSQIGVLLADAKRLESRAAFLSHWSEFVAIAADDPVFNNLPARYVRQKK